MTLSRATIVVPIISAVLAGGTADSIHRFGPQPQRPDLPVVKHVDLPDGGHITQYLDVALFSLRDAAESARLVALNDDTRFDGLIAGYMHQRNTVTNRRNDATSPMARTQAQDSIDELSACIRELEDARACAATIARMADDILLALAHCRKGG